MAMKRKHARSQKSWRPLLVSVQGWPDVLPRAEATVPIPLRPYAEKSPTISAHKVVLVTVCSCFSSRLEGLDLTIVCIPWMQAACWRALLTRTLWCDGALPRASGALLAA